MVNLQKEGIVFNGVIIDSTTMNVHQRHGGGQKGGNRPKGRVERG
jgi:hypothetical protein